MFVLFQIKLVVHVFFLTNSYFFQLWHWSWLPDMVFKTTGKLFSLLLLCMFVSVLFVSICKVLILFVFMHVFFLTNSYFFSYYFFYFVFGSFFIFPFTRLSTKKHPAGKFFFPFPVVHVCFGIICLYLQGFNFFFVMHVFFLIIIIFCYVVVHFLLSGKVLTFASRRAWFCWCAFFDGKRGFAFLFLLFFSCMFSFCSDPC